MSKFYLAISIVDIVMLFAIYIFAKIQDGKRVFGFIKDGLWIVLILFNLGAIIFCFLHP